MHSVIMTPMFLSQAKRAGLNDEDIQQICAALASSPVGGDLISGAGGARKMRHAGRGRGKSGGYRTIHFYGGDDFPLFLLAVYGKGDKANISQAEKNALSSLLSNITALYHKDAPK